MEIAGLPLHPLVVHAVVVFAPLAALAAIAYAVLPGWRWALRWPLVALTLVAVVMAVLAALSGEALLEARDLGQREDVRTHQERGLLLRNVLLGFTVVSLGAAFRLGGPSGLASGRGARARRGGGLDLAVTGLLAVGALAVLVTAVLAGDSGSRAVWGS